MKVALKALQRQVTELERDLTPTGKADPRLNLECVLPGTNTFTAWDASAHTTQTLTITAATSTSISVA